MTTRQIIEQAARLANAHLIRVTRRRPRMKIQRFRGDVFTRIIDPGPDW